MTEKVNILGIKINKVNMKEAKDKVKDFVTTAGRCHMVVTPNSEMVVMAQDDPELAVILNQADLSIPDGIGVVLASRLLKNPLVERVTGFDFMKELFSLAFAKGYSIYLLGGKPGIVEMARENIYKEYPGINICGVHHGYLDHKIQGKVINDINNLSPDLLFVGMGVPLQEKFIYKNCQRLKVGVALTIGGSFDILAGCSKRAPEWMQNAHLEWLFRLIQEPSRLIRILSLPRFVFLVLLKVLKNYLKGDSYK